MILSVSASQGFCCYERYPELTGCLTANFMDYSNPRCQTSFTEGQINRMRSSISQFRDYGY